MIYMEKIGILNDSPLNLLGLEQFLLSLNPRISGIQKFTSAEPLLLKGTACNLELLVCDLVALEGTADYRAKVLKTLCSLYPRLRLVIYSYNRNADLLQNLDHSTQISLISRHETLQITQEYFLQVLAGFKVCSPFIRSEIVKYTSISMTLAKKLTDNEIQVLESLFSGISIAEMSYRFKRNVKTLSAHKRSAMRKLGVVSDAALYSLQSHLSNMNGS